MLYEWQLAERLANSYNNEKKFLPSKDFDNEKLQFLANDLFSNLEFTESFEETLSSIFSILSDKDRVKIIDLAFANVQEGIEIEEIRNEINNYYPLLDKIHDFETNLHFLISLDILKKEKSKIVPGSNMETIIVGLECLRNAVHEIQIYPGVLVSLNNNSSKYGAPINQTTRSPPGSGSQIIKNEASKTKKSKENEHLGVYQTPTIRN